MIFVGALTKLLGRGRVSGVGAVRACALTTLQQGMGGLAERMHPPFARVQPSSFDAVNVDQLEDVGEGQLLATLPAPITAIAELIVVPALCQLTSAQAHSRRRPIGHILSLLSDRPSTLLRPPRCGIWCCVQIQLDNL
jgi:hypothetical protein